MKNVWLVTSAITPSQGSMAWLEAGSRGAHGQVEGTFPPCLLVCDDRLKFTQYFQISMSLNDSVSEDLSSIFYWSSRSLG
ncbi:hypothetical protein DL98DRAFT_511465 [Cadophora sp. DSE1049]|nr:hypothetical protein DL98DRAFT_511465 [Cadophora sp. DSE1049]